jgi:hypothetical protein
LNDFLAVEAIVGILVIGLITQNTQTGYGSPPPASAPLMRASR